MDKIKRAQKLLVEFGIDGWLLYDYKRSNPMAIDFLNIPKETHLTRRFFYWIPAEGEPVKIYSRIENPLSHLPGIDRPFLSWQELERHLSKTIFGKVAMEYFPMGALPTLSRLDAGTYEWIRRFSKEIVSSEKIWSPLTVPLTPEQIASHKRAAHHLNEIVDLAHKKMRENLGQIDEVGLQTFIMKEFQRRNLVTEGLPIVAVGPHTASPHFSPSKKEALPIDKDCLVLIDLWAKEAAPGSIYADFTRMASTYKKTPEEIEKAFHCVREAQLCAIALMKSKRPVCGYEVDRAARDFLQEKGIADYFIHRTGHNIREETHGPGTNNDDLETHDTREHLPNTICSIEPGLYFPGRFGIRLECNVILEATLSVEVSGVLQKDLG